MNRVRIVVVAVMALLLGGVVFEVGRGQAAPGDQDPWAAPPPPPVGPLPPKAPKAPKPPKAPKIRGAGNGISISIHGNKVHIDGLDHLVSGHLQNVRDMLASNPNIPKDVRDKITQRMDKVKAIVDRHVKNLDTSDLDKLDDQLEKMGDELEKAMAGLDADLAKLGDKLSKDLAKDITKNLKDMKFKFGPDDVDPDDHDADDDDDDHDNDSDTDDDDLPNKVIDSDIDMQSAVDNLKNFSLKPAQKDAIAKLRADADAKVEGERKALELASQKLETALANVDVKDAEVERLVNEITSREANIRKARLLSWVQARRVLDSDQVRQLEAAAHRTK